MQNGRRLSPRPALFGPLPRATLSFIACTPIIVGALGLVKRNFVLRRLLLAPHAHAADGDQYAIKPEQHQVYAGKILYDRKREQRAEQHHKT